MRTVISNGTYRFHLAPLAAEMHGMGCLSALLTGGYPKGAWRNLLRKAPLAGLRRLADRCENIPDEKVIAFQRTEMRFKTAEVFGKIGGAPWLESMQTKGFHAYAGLAHKALTKLEFDIYHYRNCFGFESAAWARDQGKTTICDHSIGHPYAVAWMRNHPFGHLPVSIPPQPLSRLEQNYLDDFAHADHILVNSTFVKETFIASGFQPDKISVAWWGVDARFLADADEALQHNLTRLSPDNLLFCGGFGRRKGAHVLMNVLEQMDEYPWTLTIAGCVEHDVKKEWEAFSEKFAHRINMKGFLDRDALSFEMCRHQLFVFPTLMEGSARVVFEAMACGCFIITTPHAGSIVEDGQHGLLTTPGDPDSLFNALKAVFSRAYDLRKTGDLNAALIREAYRQDQYAKRVFKVYETVRNKH